MEGEVVKVCVQAATNCHNGHCLEERHGKSNIYVVGGLLLVG